jgi:WhiB family redox-sensing transcriptional regulator
MHEDTSWKARGKCRGIHPDLFHPGRGENKDNDAAKRICADCPVRAECLEYALSFEDDADCGIWGGTSARQRRAIRHERRVAA